MNKLQQFWINLKSFSKESVRVVKVTKKPSMKNFKTIVKVSAMGMVIVGVIGFIISIVGTLMGLN